ncbi:MAG: hypothetical protein FWF77_09665 [Defluviitaleaceae bacterium]|nr:hypothetical protein [Defluviitaleaceae bacterium]
MGKGLSVKGMNAVEISKKLEKYLTAHFKGFILDDGESLFQEGHLFCLEEIDGIFPENYFQRFADDSKFITMCGFFNADDTQSDTTERILTLVLEELHEYALLLCVQDADKDGAERTTIIKDFLA